jgi:hypothetical protein
MDKGKNDINATAASPVATKAPVADPTHSDPGHVTFLKIPEEDKAQRAQERHRWREPLYSVPVGATHSCPQLGVTVKSGAVVRNVVPARVSNFECVQARAFCWLSSPTSSPQNQIVVVHLPIVPQRCLDRPSSS